MQRRPSCPAGADKKSRAFAVSGLGSRLGMGSSLSVVDVVASIVVVVVVAVVVDVVVVVSDSKEHWPLQCMLYNRPHNL